MFLPASLISVALPTDITTNMVAGWQSLEQVSQLDQIINNSKGGNSFGAVVFKHSTRCSISAMAKSRLERAFAQLPSDFPFYYLDLIAHRDVSNHIADVLQVRHESPQILVISNGQCVYHASHQDISPDELAGVIKNETA